MVYHRGDFLILNRPVPHLRRWLLFLGALFFGAIALDDRLTKPYSNNILFKIVKCQYLNLCF